MTKEVPADIPTRFTTPCGDPEILPYGSTLGELLEHSNNRYKQGNECADQVDELREWNKKDVEKSSNAK